MLSVPPVVRLWSMPTMLAAALCALPIHALSTPQKPAPMSVDQLRGAFANPPAQYRALPLLYFDYANPASAAKSARDRGFGGVIIQHPGTGAGYLRSEDGWSKFGAAVKSLRDAGLLAWIYDEDGYPSGKAGSLTLDGHPEYEPVGLYYTSADYDAEAPRTVRWTIPAGEPYYVALCRMDAAGARLTGECRDVTAAVRDGAVETRVERGRWRVVAFVANRLYDGTHASLLHTRYINILDAAAVRRFLEVTHEQYFAHMGDEFGKTIRAFFTDEPSLMGGVLTDQAQPYPVLSWHSSLPAAFRKRAGYDIRQALPALFNDEGPGTTRKRCDYWSTVAHAVADSYFGQIETWCARHHVASMGHLLWEESLLYHVPFYGSMMPSLARFDIPGMDLLGCNYGRTSGSRTEGGPITPKLVSSAAHLYGKSRTASESFCFVTAATPMDDLIAQVAWQWVLGINTLATLSTNEAHQPADHRRLNAYTGRLSLALTRGTYVTHAAVLYPIASVWAGFTPSRNPVWHMEDNPAGAEVDRVFQAVSRQMLACRRDFDYVDEESIERAEVSGGAIRLGANRVTLLVLPRATTLRFSTLRKLARFVESGGSLVSVGAKPSQREDRGPAGPFQAMVGSLWAGGKHGRGRVIHIVQPDDLPSALARCDQPDVLVEPDTRDVYYQRRALQSGDIYFVVNTGAKPVTGSFTFRAQGNAEVWDPLTGAVERRAAAGRANARRVHLDLPPRGGLLVVFGK